MANRIPLVAALAFAAMLSLPARGGTLEQDEAMLEAVERARQTAAKAPPAKPGARTSASVASRGEPAPVVATVIAKKATASPNDDWLAPPPPDDAGLSFADLARHVGERVTIVTVAQRVHRGVVRRADGRQVVLQVKRRGGSATYALRRDQIVRIEPR